MAAGWKLRQGEFLTDKISEDEIWQRINFFYSENCKKRNSYKFGLIKSIIDSVFSMTCIGKGYYISYDELFEKFTHNYWNLVVKYNLRQMRSDGRSDISMIEKIILDYKENNLSGLELDYDAIVDSDRADIVKLVKSECKKYVLGALYEDFDGYIYSFDLKGNGIYLNPIFYEFFIRYKIEIEKINYYEWAKFLEKVNSDEVLIRVIDKLELSTPKRNDLSVYRYILEKEFEQNNCFYCGKKLTGNVHVDHFIPWSFVHDDKVWNFVLSCSTCNIKKNNRIPTTKYLAEIKHRNDVLVGTVSHPIVIEQFNVYSIDKIERMWKYAMLSGYKEYS